MQIFVDGGTELGVVDRPPLGVAGIPGAVDAVASLLGHTDVEVVEHVKHDDDVENWTEKDHVQKSQELSLMGRSG